MKIDLQYFGGRGSSSVSRNGSGSQSVVDWYGNTVKKSDFKLKKPRNEKYPLDMLSGFQTKKDSNAYEGVWSQISDKKDSVLLAVDSSNIIKGTGRYGAWYGLKIDREHFAFGRGDDVWRDRRGVNYLRINKKYYKQKEASRPFEDMGSGKGMSWDDVYRLAKAQDRDRRKSKLHLSLTPETHGWD